MKFSPLIGPPPPLMVAASKSAFKLEDDEDFVKSLFSFDDEGSPTRGDCGDWGFNEADDDGHMVTSPPELLRVLVT